MILTQSQILQYAMAAGFTGSSAQIIAAIAMAESGGNTLAQGHNTDGSIDRGLYQINNRWHPEVSDSCAYDPTCSSSAAYRISSAGTNFTPWSTFNSGAYRRYLQSSVLPPSGVAVTVDQIFTSKNLWKWYSSPVTNKFDGVSEKGEDFSTSWGTPVGSVTAGTVVRTEHNTNSIGDVIEIMAPDGSVFLYQHITARVRVNQQISVGDIVGTENGLPVDQYSTGPHIEVRYCPPGKWKSTIDSWDEPWVNPSSVFLSIGRASATGGGSGGVVPVGFSTGTTPSYSHLTDLVHQTLVNVPGFYGIALAVDEAEQFPGWVDLTQPASTPDIPGVGSVSIPDFVGLARSIGATASDNFLPFAIRSGTAIFGIVLLLALIIKAAGGVVLGALKFVG